MFSVRFTDLTVPVESTRNSPGRAISAPTRMPEGLPAPSNAALPALSEKHLRTMMTSHVGVIRDGDHLAQAVRTFARLERDAGNMALRNMAISALLVAASALTRRESRGAHCRSDYAGETTASSSEFDASRLAPCAPVEDTSPPAHRPSIELRPRASTAMPPMW